jgi:hypothetical protein
MPLMQGWKRAQLLWWGSCTILEQATNAHQLLGKLISSCLQLRSP